MDVKVTGVPVQTGFSLADMVTLTGMSVLTIMMTLLEVAGLPEAQEASEVRIQDTTSPFSGTNAKTGLLVPELTPLTFH
jgi:hypothetical protein